MYGKNGEWAVEMMRIQRTVLKRKGAHLILLSILCLSIFSIFFNCSKFRKEIKIPQETIQKALAEKFPYDKNAVIARITLSEPKVYFKDSCIGIQMMYVGNFLEKEVAGDIDFNGHIVYEEGTFYIANFEIVNFTVDEKEFTSKGKLKKVVIKIIKNYIDGYPVYRLKQSDFKQNLAKLLLKDITFEGDNINILIGL